MARRDFEEPIRQAMKYFFLGFQELAEVAGIEQTQSVGGWPPTMPRGMARDYLVVGDSKFYELIRSGQIPDGVLIAGVKRWFKKDLDRYLEQQTRKNRNNVKRVPPKRRKP